MGVSIRTDTTSCTCRYREIYRLSWVFAVAVYVWVVTVPLSLCVSLCFSLTLTICCVPSATYTTISCICVYVSISLHYILYLLYYLPLYLVSTNSPRRPSRLSCAYVRILPYILSYSYILCLCLHLTTASCSTTISCTIYSQYPISRPTTSPVHTAISSSVRLLLLHHRLLHNPLSRPSQRRLCVLFGSL